ncbi:hypothetical protein CC85DRAFT_278031 [Cutaneotrichosporon oleaginosum]|uniref:Golgi apparatus membrane protein TVP38 n=1 Tax=Cutaneotrichosporon oleaginosum TaxID=879819 RepID=A0A0J0XH04_9TREE|nr:uncharacterized protein CC85DRAFT_278031 [Cutaneotrichosporon oleaginosum]KLT40307.1 hypothetical protein CC85DRAFT_278031 [Cutaneotrichosporon oleaginosum]TXT07981.1 hypothetical protein COLE_04905 [Cutaneotrichosporon oleaginosum]
MINGLIIAAIIIITPKRIGHWFNNLADSLKDMGFLGMVLISLCVIASSHPPLFGFSACMTMIGFAYGLWFGIFLGSVASLMGAALAWFSVRHFFLDWMRKFGASKNKQWEAFGCVMRDKGLPLVVMIRWCPLPWAIGNGLFASIDGVEFHHYMIANLAFIPRLAIPVFIGSRLNSMSDGKDVKPDPLRFWLNLSSIALSLVVSVGTGTLIYRLTLRQMRRMEHEGHPDEGELAAEAFESTALLGDFSDEEVDEELVPRQQV